MLTNKPKQCPFKLSMFMKRIWVQVIEFVIISSNGIESKRKNDILYLKGNENKRKCEWTSSWITYDTKYTNAFGNTHTMLMESFGAQMIQNAM